MRPRFLGFEPGTIVFVPSSAVPPAMGGEPIYMSYDEYEAFRLTYYEKLSQEEAAKRMKISRGTLWRCLESARDKVARMLIEHRPLIVTSEPPSPTGEDTGSRKRIIG
ncbi:MAG: DUF134 domain-containing protein [Candidatus Brockarchaeota archaeon]|nr:DUF134 domain-containing protein [Candidatus Brockarchaeota archaeon]MBO3842269.1 DUF134 domain-containing protein [Candidatus Brockarchaeota archaeon]